MIQTLAGKPSCRLETGKKLARFSGSGAAAGAELSEARFIPAADIRVSYPGAASVPYPGTTSVSYLFHTPFQKVEFHTRVIPRFKGGSFGNKSFGTLP